MKFSTVSTPSLLMAVSVVMRLACEMIAVSAEAENIKGTVLEPFQLQLQGCVGHLSQTSEGCRLLAVAMMLPEMTKAGYHADLPQNKDVSPS